MTGHSPHESSLRIVRTGAWVFAALLLVSAQFGSAASANPPPAKKLDAVEARIKTAEKWIRDARRTESQSTRQLREAEARLADAQRELERLHALQSSLRTETSKLDAMIEAGEARRHQLTAQAGAHLRALQRSGGGDPLRAMLSARDPSAAPRLLAYYGYLSRARQQVTKRMQDNERALQANRERLAQQQALIAAQQQAVETETQRIAALQSDRRSAIERARKEIGSRTTELKNLQTERNALQRLIESLAQRARTPPPTPTDQNRPRNRPPRQGTTPTPTGSTLATLAPDTAFSRTRGQLPWPVQGLIEASYGTAKGSTNMRWEGLLIRANVGTEVRAVHAGEVAFAGWLRSLGNLLIVDHGGGYMSLYAHLDSLARRTGERIAPGTSVGRVGASGGRETPALYFELRHRGNPIDPRAWLSRQ